MKQKYWSIVVLLVLLWMLSLATNTTLNGYAHLLIITAVTMALVLVFQGNRRGNENKESEL